MLDFKLRTHVPELQHFLVLRSADNFTASGHKLGAELHLRCYRHINVSLWAFSNQSVEAMTKCCFPRVWMWRCIYLSMLVWSLPAQKVGLGREDDPKPPTKHAIYTYTGGSGWKLWFTEPPPPPFVSITHNKQRQKVKHLLKRKRFIKNKNHKYKPVRTVSFWHYYDNNYSSWL